MQTAFLVMREILNEENEKARADILVQFIKIAKVMLGTGMHMLDCLALWSCVL